MIITPIDDFEFVSGKCLTDGPPPYGVGLLLKDSSHAYHGIFLYHTSMVFTTPRVFIRALADFGVDYEVRRLEEHIDVAGMQREYIEHAEYIRPKEMAYSGASHWQKVAKHVLFGEKPPLDFSPLALPPKTA
jgi:hypothetical protein